jgi:hypothetical protein
LGEVPDAAAAGVAAVRIGGIKKRWRGEGKGRRRAGGVVVVENSSRTAAAGGAAEQRGGEMIWEQ